MNSQQSVSNALCIKTSKANLIPYIEKTKFNFFIKLGMSIKIKKTGQKTIENYKTRVFSLEHLIKSFNRLKLRIICPLNGTNMTQIIS